jgi:ABC-type multidrug transport system fused ATPase/permease subunit
MFGVGKLMRQPPAGASARQRPGEPTFEVRHFSAREVASHIWPLVRPHVWGLLLGAVLVAIVGLAVAVGPLLGKYIIDFAIARRSMGLALAIGGVFLATQLARMGIWYAAQRIVLRIKELILYQLRSDGFAHLQGLCLHFHNKYPSGFLYDRIFGSSINTLGAFLQSFFQQFAVYIAGLVFSLALCLWMSPPLTGVIVLGAAGYIVASRLLSPLLYAKHLAFMSEANRIAQYIVDKLRGTKTIQSLAMEGRVQDEFEARVWPMQLKSLEAQFAGMKLHFVTEGLGYLITACIAVTGAWVVMADRLEVGTLVAFMGYQGMLIGFVGQIVNVYGQFMSARAGFDQLFTVLRTQATVAQRPEASLPRPLRGELAFGDVTFAYDSRPVIRELTVTIPPGQTVALVGRSGGGKTTFINLLLRFYDPASGRLMLDGQDVRQLPLRPYRALFGVVLQDPYLFDDTIERNLRYAAPLASDEELWEALDKAQAADFVRAFPMGIQHRCGESGASLSGGQKQRLAIARCMLMQPRFLIFDEATSALDNETEHHVQKAMDSLFAGRTAFIIAHRLSTIRRADRVLVLDDGRLVEDGTYQQLIARGGIFARLHAIATGGAETGTKLDHAGFA